MASKAGIDERNREIYEAHKNGETYKKLSEKYGLNPNHISNICKRLDRAPTNRSKLMDLLASHYPEMQKEVRSGTVGSILDYLVAHGASRDIRSTIDLDGLINGYLSIPENKRRYPFMRAFGEKKKAFIERVMSDRKDGLI